MERSMTGIHKGRGRENGENSLIGKQWRRGKESRERLSFKERFLHNEGGFGMNELLGIAAALIIAGFVIIPGLRKFAGTLMDALSSWWGSTIEKHIFSTSVLDLAQQIVPFV